MSAPILQTEELRKSFGGVVATDRVSLALSPGEIHAIIGPNGAGKTTLVHQLSGTIVPDAGRIYFDGRDITRVPPHERVLRGLVRSYQVTSVFRGLSVLDNIALAVQARTGSSFRFWRPRAREAALFDEARRVSARVGLAGRETAAAASLSHGEQRQLEVGLAVATQPSVLLLDEPMAGMGPEESARLIDLIRDLAQSGRLSILLIEHDMDAVFRLAHRISVLVSGRVIATGTPLAIRANAEVRRAYLGDDAAGAAR